MVPLVTARPHVLGGCKWKVGPQPLGIHRMEGHGRATATGNLGKQRPLQNLWDYKKTPLFVGQYQSSLNSILTHLPRAVFLSVARLPPREILGHLSRLMVNVNTRLRVAIAHCAVTVLELPLHGAVTV